MSIRFVKFEIKQWLSAYQHQFYAWYSLALGRPKETWRRSEWQWVSTLGLIRDCRQQTGYLGGARIPALFSIRREGTDDSLARLPTETARVFFLNLFLKETALSLFFLLLEPVQCLDKNFLYLNFCPAT